jgi:hypothetical protein
VSVIPNRPNTVNGWTPEEAAALRFYGVDPSRASRNEYSVNFYNGMGYVQQVVSTALPSAGAANAAPKPVEWTQQSLIGGNAVVPVIYGGRTRVGLLIVGIVERYGFLYITGLIGRGEIGRIESIEIDGVPVTTQIGGISVATFTGSQTQQVYAPLVSAYQAKGITFNDAMRGYAYAVIIVPSSVKLPGAPRLTATIGDGKLCVDPAHGSNLIPSHNPIVAMCDFITSPLYGLGKQYDQPSAAAAKAWCDEASLVQNTLPRRRISLAMTEARPVEDWFAHLQMYTGCAIWERGGVYYFKPLKAEAASRTVGMHEIVGGTLRVARPSLRELPNKVTVAYTDTTDNANWQTARQSAPANTAGLAAIRESTLSLPGIIRPEQAASDALERYNRFRVATTEVQFGAFDEALPYHLGEVLRLQLPPYSIDAEFRIIDIKDSGFGRYLVTAEQYAASIYGGTPVVTAPPINGGGMVPGLLPIVMVPPVEGVEETVQLPDGSWQSRLRFSWHPPQDGNAAFYFATLTDVTLTGQPVVVDSRQLGTTSYVSYPVLPGHQYALSVYAISAIGSPSNTITSAPVPVVGKDFPPPNVGGFSAIEAGGDVFMSWQRPSDPDVAGFVIKVGPPGTPWDQMTQITDIDATTYVAFNQAEGTFDYAIKAKDNSGQYSANATRTTVVVTHDAGKIVTRGPFPFLTYPPDEPALQAEEYAPPVATPAVVVSFDPDGHWGDGADNPDDNVGTFDDSLRDVPISIPNDQPSMFEAATCDAGALLTGDWHLSGDAGVIYGDPSLVKLTLLSSPDNVTFTPLPPSLVGTGRYFRMRLEIPPNVAIRSPETWGVTYTVQPTTEFGSIDVPPSGVATVVLTGNYSVYDSILVTIVGGADAAYARADNVQINGVSDRFDVKLFTAAGQPTSGRVSWSFQGT